MVIFPSPIKSKGVYMLCAQCFVLCLETCIKTKRTCHQHVACFINSGLDLCRVVFLYLVLVLLKKTITPVRNEENRRRSEVPAATWLFLFSLFHKVYMYLPDFVCIQCTQLFVQVFVLESQSLCFFFSYTIHLVVEKLYFITSVVDQEENGHNHSLQPGLI